MKIYRTTQYRGKEIWTQRYCTTRRQWGALKQDLRYMHVTRMTLEMIEVSDDMWLHVETLEDEF